MAMAVVMMVVVMVIIHVECRAFNEFFVAAVLKIMCGLVFARGAFARTEMLSC